MTTKATFILVNRELCIVNGESGFECKVYSLAYQPLIILRKTGNLLPEI